MPTHPPVPCWHCPHQHCSGACSSCPVASQAPEPPEWKTLFVSSQGRVNGEKRSLSWKGWFTFLKKMPALRRAAGFWLQTEPKGFENELGDLGCWHFTEPGLGPGLQIRSSGSPARSCKMEIGGWGEAVVSPSHEKGKLVSSKPLLCCADAPKIPCVYPGEEQHGDLAAPGLWMKHRTPFRATGLHRGGSGMLHGSPLLEDNQSSTGWGTPALSLPISSLAAGRAGVSPRGNPLIKAYKTGDNLGSFLQHWRPCAPLSFLRMLLWRVTPLAPLTTFDGQCYRIRISSLVQGCKRAGASNTDTSATRQVLALPTSWKDFYLLFHSLTAPKVHC